MQQLEERFGILAARPDSPGSGLKARLIHTFHYWMQTEVHVYGFSIAANVLLSFFPFLIVIYSLCREVLGLRGAAEAINVALRDYFPGTLGVFIDSNLHALTHRGLQFGSLFLLLFTANGVFEPLEVALNRCWGISTNRSFVKNQLVSLGLIFVCGTLGLASSLLTGLNRNWLGSAEFPMTIFFKMAAVPMSILMLFLIYWLLPNAKISPRFVLPPAIFVGLALEALKWVNVLTWPLLRRKLHAEYGPFYYSVTIVLWSFLASMVILAGAEWAARASAGARGKSSLAPGPIATPER